MSKIATRFDVTTCNSAEDLLTKCGLNWEPEIRSANHVTDSVETSYNAEAFRAVVNPSNGRALAFVSPRFKPNSHMKAVHDAWGLVRHGSATPHAVSVWDGGGKMALQFRCPELDVRIGSKSVVSPLLTLVVNHDAGGADRAFFCDFDFWCRNQAGMVARVQGDGVRHTGTIIQRYEDVVEDRIIALRTGMGDRYETMRRMADSSVRLNGSELVGYFARALDIAPESVATAFSAAKANEVLSADGKVLKAIVGDWRADDHGAPGTVWHAYSAVTRYTTHTEGRSEAVRAQRAIMGAQDRFVRAFNEAALLVNA